MTTPISDISTILKITPRISSKLHDENDYPAWVVEASRQLRRQKLLTIVTDPVPSTITPEYQDKSDKALDYLIDSVEVEPAIKIRACETAADAWKILKDTYEGQTRTHMTALFSNLVSLRFDDSDGSTLMDHIVQFEGNWLRLAAQAAATGSSTAGSMAADIKTFSQSDAWKAYILLATLPGIQPYINIVQNITSTEDKPTYANVIIRLKEIPQNRPEQDPDSDPKLPLSQHYNKYVSSTANQKVGQEPPITKETAGRKSGIKRSNKHLQHNKVSGTIGFSECTLDTTRVKNQRWRGVCKKHLGNPLPD